ncbi:STAS-like domain-containing protein [Microcoleus sp. Pol10D4]|uniref:STAS-like domain-containing protein n=1 Tax=Microcoleus sp. Pol10D4 TaxID=3055387 RepID=UPI002FD556C8
MKATEALQLNAFLAALTQLDGKLPVEIQNQLNDIGKEFPASVSKLGTLAKSYSPLDKIYKEARRVLRSHEGERLRFTTPDPEETAQSNEEEIIGLAVNIFNSSNSVASAKKAAAESGVFKQLLVQLQGETSFSVPDTHLANVGASQAHRVYNIRNLVGGICITPDDGQKVYDLIHPELIAGNLVELDFTGVDIIGPPFLNAAIGELLKDLQPEDIDHLLKVSNLIPLGMRVMKRVIENSKEYYSDEKTGKAVDEVLREQALSF